MAHTQQHGSCIQFCESKHEIGDIFIQEHQFQTIIHLPWPGCIDYIVSSNYECLMVVQRKYQYPYYILRSTINDEKGQKHFEHLYALSCEQTYSIKI